jgi:FkbM family methyltransferase
MEPNFVFQKILRRPFYKGQDRLFNWLFKKNKLNQGWQIVKPAEDNFIIKCDTSTWIGAKIVYTGDYEAEFKKITRTILKKGDHVLDVGANIGFHTLFFAELVGKLGSVTAFEPVPCNYNILNDNIGLNKFDQVTCKKIALSNKNEQLSIFIDEKTTNPGAFNLFDRGGDTLIDCCIGDEIVGNRKVDFIKIDVEGYESFVIEGLLETIKKNRPKIMFEYDIEYHKKTGLVTDYIFLMLSNLNYRFMHIFQEGLVDLKNFSNPKSGNILAIPND